MFPTQETCIKLRTIAQKPEIALCFHLGKLDWAGWGRFSILNATTFQLLWSALKAEDLGTNGSQIDILVRGQTALVFFENRACRQSGFPTFISCQRQDANVLPKRRQSHQGDKLCDISTVPLVARWPVFLARRSDADSEPH